MHNSDLITPQHLTRKAVISIRQSTPHQVVSHQESLRLQYALGERARQLGWPDEAIDIIDDDLGLTKSAEKPRHSCRGGIGVGRAGLNAQEPNKTHAVPEPSMGEGTAEREAPAFMPGRTSRFPLASSRRILCDSDHRLAKRSERWNGSLR